MNAKYANSNIPIINYLAFRGYKPVRICWAEYYYISPLRPWEKTPSFCVNVIKNYWYDHWLDMWSNLVNLVIELEHTTVSGALSVLDCTPHNYQEKIDTTKLSKKLNDAKTSIVKVQTIENVALKNYLRERRIPLEIGNLYFNEVHYSLETISNRTFFWLGFACWDGFATANRTKKIFVGSKHDISYIPWNRTLANKLCKSVLVFEGAFDFVSSVVLGKKERFEEDSIVLHGVGMADRAKEFIKWKLYKKIFLCLDNDKSGKRTAKNFRISIEKNDLWQDVSKEVLPEERFEIVDLSYKYKGFKDLNDFLKAQ